MKKIMKKMFGIIEQINKGKELSKASFDNFGIDKVGRNKI